MPETGARHEWRRDAQGRIDLFGFEYDFHNGPTCDACGECVCEHCEPDWADLRTCDGPNGIIQGEAVVRAIER